MVLLPVAKDLVRRKKLVAKRTVNNDRSVDTSECFYINSQSLKLESYELLSLTDDIVGITDTWINCGTQFTH